MASNFFMVITDQSGAVLAGESTTSIVNPYTKATVKAPVEIQSILGKTENVTTIGSGTGTSAGKVTFDPLTVVKRIDKLSQATFLAHASGTPWKYVDLIAVKSTGTATPQPYLAYRLGTVFIQSIQSQSDDDAGVVESVEFVFGQFQIGYQAQAANGTLGAFTPVGWDRVKNVKI